MGIETTDVVEDARKRHGLSPTATAALGRTLTGVSLLSFLLSKTPQERVLIQFSGDGELGGPTAEGSTDGSVRGWVQNPLAEPPLRPDGKLNVGEAVGQGQLKVSRALGGGELYEGSVPITSGEIAEDITNYLWKSEQIPSALLLGVKVAPDGSVESAGGFVVQVLPGCPEEIISKLEMNLKDRPGISEMLLEWGLEATLEELMFDLEYESMDLRGIGFKDGFIPIFFKCRCSREKAVSSLMYFSHEEREEMIAQDGGAEVGCHWCGEKYKITPEEINSLPSKEEFEVLRHDLN